MEGGELFKTAQMDSRVDSRKIFDETRERPVNGGRGGGGSSPRNVFFVAS
jgi:hypothetical protein